LRRVPRFGPGKSQRRENVCAPVHDQTTTQSRWQAEGAHFSGDQPLCSRGYEATTTREIAARAGCAEGLVHRYFGGKSGLLFNIVELHVAQDTATTIGRPACARLEAEIRKLMDLQLDHLRDEREFLCVAFSCAILQPRLGKLLRKYMPARTGLIAQRIQRDKKCRSANDEEIEVLAHALISMSFDRGFIRPVILGQDREQTKTLARRAAKLLSGSILTDQC
jgi:AcrR family transcriptional regulator